MQISTTLSGVAPVKASRPAGRLLRALRARRPGHAVRGAKTLIAALLTWGAWESWAPTGQPFLAVATALLMVNASTVHQSVTKAMHSVAARVAGLVVALAAARLLGPTAGAVAVIALLAVLAGPRRTADERLQIASTAVVALTATTTGPLGSLVSPVLQTLTGAVVGIAVNAVLLPPLYVDESASAVRDLAHAMGSLLSDMGDGLERRQLGSRAHGWLHRARSLDKRLAHAEEQVRQADESLRWNTRCVVAPAGRGEMPTGDAFRALRGVALQVRGIARTLADSAQDRHADHHLGHQFLDRYAETLKSAGAAVREFVQPSGPAGSPDTMPRERLRQAIEGVLAWHETMTSLIGRGTLIKPGAWHVYGSLMTDVERLLADLTYADAYANRLSQQGVR
ncbi:aromatic acid exporter family protein [Streptomyces sp. NK08204]|uniref:aromatic acid exporter family protein n=1 Tax=Streptomyces sp. NK08204 TaxID=2873260 RepID=UPI001CEDC82D|nr:aromatic acid exporter family protein [Streptomyces sp. NK08204]